MIGDGNFSKLVKVMYLYLTRKEAEKCCDHLDKYEPLAAPRSCEILAPGRDPGEPEPTIVTRVNHLDTLRREMDDRRFRASFERRYSKGFRFVSIAECLRFAALA